MSEGTKSESRHFTLRPGFAVLVGLLVLALYFLWAAYGAAPTSLSFLTEMPDEPTAVMPMAGMDVESASMEGMAMAGHGAGVGAMTPDEFHEITVKFAEDLALPDGSVPPAREWMEALEAGGAAVAAHTARGSAGCAASAAPLAASRQG